MKKVDCKHCGGYMEGLGASICPPQPERYNYVEQFSGIPVEEFKNGRYTYYEESYNHIIAFGTQIAGENVFQTITKMTRSQYEKHLK